MTLAKKLETWQNDLIDMSRNNNLLYYRTTGRFKSGIQFIGDIPELFTRIAHNPRPIQAEQLASTLEPEELEQRLNSLRTKARDDLNERGVNALYCAFGMLEWRETEHSEEVVRSPLLLVPMTLSRSGVLGKMELKRLGDEEIEVNPTLRAKLDHDFGIELPTCGVLEDEFGGSLDQATNALVTQSNRHASEKPSLSWLLARLAAAIPDQFGWTVSPELHLSRFSFQKLVMYQDLERNKELLLTHEVLQVLGGEPISLPMPHLPPANQLDQHIRPHDSLEILDADSSQQEAILLATRGASFVLQGPPGTGKSQTIANIIAECLGLGKRVLFVSEKMAALEVVQLRLRNAGLGNFCLDLHNARRDKQTFVKELKAAMQEAELLDAHPVDRLWQQEADALYDVRERLNTYVRDLHTPALALQRTPFQAYGALASLRDASDRDFRIPNVEALTVADLDRKRSALRELIEYVDVLDAYETHPWRRCVVTSYTYGLASSIRAHFARLIETQARLEGDLPTLLEQLGEPESDLSSAGAVRCVERGTAVLGSPLPPRHWLSEGDRSHIRELLAAGARRTASYRSNRERLEVSHDPALLDLDHQALLHALTDVSSSSIALLIPYGMAPQDIALAHQTELDSHLRAAVAGLRQLRSTAQEVATLCHLPEPRSLADMQVLLRLSACFVRSPSAPMRWLDPEAFPQIRAVALDAIERGTRRAQLRGGLAATYQPDFFEFDTGPVALRFKNRYQSPLRFVRPGYHRDRTHLRALMLPGRQRSDAEMERDCWQAVKLHEEEQVLTDHRVEYAGILGHYFYGERTDWEQVRAALAWTTELHSFGLRLAPEAQQLLTGPRHERAKLEARWQELERLWRAWQHEAGFLTRAFHVDRLLANNPSLELAPLDTLIAALARVHEVLQTFWTAARSVIQHLKTPPTHPGESRAWSVLCDDVRLAASIVGDRQWLEGHAEELAVALQLRYVGLETDWAEAQLALAWADQFAQLYAPASIPALVLNLVSEGRDAAEHAALSAAAQRVRSALDELDAEWRYCDSVLPRSALCTPEHTFDQTPLRDLRERVQALLEALPLLERWVACAEHIRRCEAEELGPLVQLCLREQPFARDVERIFERRFYALWLDRVLQGRPALARFRGELHHRLIKEFGAREERHRRLASARLIKHLAQRRSTALLPSGARRTTENASLVDAVRAIKKEVTLKRHAAIRTIVRRTAPALLELKPCWMMSPLSVSQFLESGEPLFDLVIFDEASQVSAEDAICAILRGRQLIVVGASQQLPPTRFFAKSLADDEDSEDEGEAQDLEDRVRRESILDECSSASLPERSLRWHYRSRNEALIAFSNRHFYENRLVTFPSPVTDESAGVRFEFVADGLYDRSKSRTNRREAERVADLVFAFARLHNGLQGLGVVALSQAQQQAIRDVLNTRVRQQPELHRWAHEVDEEEPDGFFVKNLESVQGDERDVIILSVGYGPDRPGVRPHTNFGPVNRQGGERRLNVAVTRAKEQLILVASMHADQLPSDLASPGARTLRNYLAFAEHGLDALRDQSIAGAPGDTESRLESPFEASVYQALTTKGLELDTQVGCSGYRIDLAVRDPDRPGRYLLGIECDGATYHSSATARDRDRLRQRQLEAMGWRIHRIWSRDWVLDLADQVRKVLLRLDAIRTESAHGEDGEDPSNATIDSNDSDENTLAALAHEAASSQSAAEVVVAPIVTNTEAESVRIGPPGMRHAADAAVSDSRSLGEPQRSPDMLSRKPASIAARVEIGSKGAASGTQRSAIEYSRSRRVCETCGYCVPQTATRFLCRFERTMKARGPNGATPGCGAWKLREA
jgi:very-short-patch-repair endonuclease